MLPVLDTVTVTPTVPAKVAVAVTATATVTGVMGTFETIETNTNYTRLELRVILIGDLSESVFSIISTFFPRNFPILHIFLIFFPEYVKFNELDFFASGEFHE